MKLAWVTDIHLNFLSLTERKKFYQKLQDVGADFVVITGDISEANDCVIYLESMKEVVKAPILFVAGNHDYYFGRVAEVRAKLTNLYKKNINYLTTLSVPYATEDAIFVGVDGWADGRYGNYMDSPVRLNDARLIFDLADTITVRMSGFLSEHEKQSLLNKMQELARIDAKQLLRQLFKAVKMGQDLIIVLTHIPPFPESSLYKGEIADDDYLPFYTSQIIGKILKSFATKYPNIDFVVLCGHSHHQAVYQPFINLLVQTGASEYHKPQIHCLDF